jgi:hypothetical protein
MTNRNEVDEISYTSIECWVGNNLLHFLPFYDFCISLAITSLARESQVPHILVSSAICLYCNKLTIVWCRLYACYHCGYSSGKLVLQTSS